MRYAVVHPAAFGSDVAVLVGQGFPIESCHAISIATGEADSAPSNRTVVSLINSWLGQLLDASTGFGSGRPGGDPPATRLIHLEAEQNADDRALSKKFR